MSTDEPLDRTNTKFRDVGMTNLTNAMAQYHCELQAWLDEELEAARYKAHSDRPCPHITDVEKDLAEMKGRIVKYQRLDTIGLHPPAQLWVYAIAFELGGRRFDLHEMADHHRIHIARRTMVFLAERIIERWKAMEYDSQRRKGNAD